MLISAIARTMHEFDSAVMDILGTNARDVPFAALYHVETANGKHTMWTVTDFQATRNSQPHTCPHQPSRIITPHPSNSDYVSQVQSVFPKDTHPLLTSYRSRCPPRLVEIAEPLLVLSHIRSLARPHCLIAVRPSRGQHHIPPLPLRMME